MTGYVARAMHHGARIGGDSLLDDGAIDLGGTIRTAIPSETLSKAREIGRQIGISRLANVTGLDHVGVPVWMAVRPLAKSLTVSQGKGLTDELAQASAIMECIELHHAEHFVPDGHRTSLRQVVGNRRYVNPLLIPILPKAAIHADRITEWVEGQDLASQRPVWVPRDCIDMDLVARRTTPKTFLASTNGLASGNTRPEAILHATCEVIERDQAAFWYARKYATNDVPRTRLRLASVPDENCRGLIDKCHASGLNLAVWYVTQSVPVPCFVCHVFDSEHRTYYPQRASGSGCHPYRRIALSRAITEALQSRLTIIAGARDDAYWSTYRNSIPIDSASGSAWVRNFQEEPETVSFDDIPQAPPLKEMSEMLDWLLAALVCEGLSQVVAVDLTQPHLAIAVVHVTVPGLEGHIVKPGYTPGPRMQCVLN